MTVFEDQYNLSDLVKLPNIHNVKKLLPFIALTKNGDVYTWTEGVPKRENTREGEHFVGFLPPTKVKDLSGIEDIASDQEMNFLAIKENHIYQFFCFYQITNLLFV